MTVHGCEFEPEVPTQPERLREWVKALRSGEYRQSRGRLRLSDAYCCLGVLCDLSGLSSWSSSLYSDAWYYGKEFSALLPDDVMELYGLENEYGFQLDCEGINRSLASLNDGGFTFPQIADLIEAKYGLAEVTP